jgi:hypothetical protein
LSRGGRVLVEPRSAWRPGAVVADRPGAAFGLGEANRRTPAFYCALAHNVARDRAIAWIAVRLRTATALPLTTCPAGAAMTECTEPYAAQYFEGRQSGQSGTHRDTNPFFSRTTNQDGIPESSEVWRSKYDVWRQGWMEGHALFEAARVTKDVGR